MSLIRARHIAIRLTSTLNEENDVSYLRGETVVQAEEHLRRYEGYILVEKVLHQNADAEVVPMTVYQQCLFQEHELGEREVGRYGSLAAFLPQYSDAYVSFLYHRDVVATITDSCGMRITPCSFYQMHDLHELH
jgi:hypothetical protein